MNQARRAVLRLACFIATIEGVRPILKGKTHRKQREGLLRQYLYFSAEQREEARRKGCQMIREIGLERVAGHLIPALPPKPRGNGKYRRNYLAYLLHMEQWGLETPHPASLPGDAGITTLAAGDMRAFQSAPGIAAG